MTNVVETDSQRRTRKLAGLLQMGFECVEGPLTTEAEMLADGWRVSQSVPAMGTVVSVSAFHESRLLSEEAIGRGLAEMDRLIAILNRHEPTSAMGVLNDTGALRSAPDELVYLLRRARGFELLSAGAFDIAVAPVVDLLRQRRESGDGRPLSNGELGEALARVEAGRVDVDGRGVRFRGERTTVTLDGMAKGFIVDRMAHALEACGADGYLINAGGDIRTAGTRDGRAPWSVAVQDPDKGGEYPDVLRLHDGAVATSGSYEIYFDRQRTLHHIIDPTGGWPVHTSSVTVRAATAMTADALATAVFVAGPEKGMPLVASIPGAACLIVAANGSILKSAGWTNRPEIAAPPGDR